MSEIILSTVGTSLITNGASPEARKLIVQYSNETSLDGIPEDHRMLIMEQIQCVREGLIGKDAATPCSLELAKKKSAELNGIACWYDGTLAKGHSDLNFLLHTDTVLGRECASLVHDFLRLNQLQVVVHPMSGMNTRDGASFKQSLSTLARWLVENLQEYRSKRWRIIFQLTGGFKSVQGFMQAAGMFLADEIVYLFESSKELMRIPRLPLDIDSGMQATVQEHLNVFRRLACSDVMECNQLPGLETFPEICIEQSEGMIALSPWGVLCWEKVKPYLYRKQLWPSAFSKIVYSEKLISAASALSAGQMQTLNERIDDFARYLDSGMQQSIRRLDFKQLKANPKPPSTHEFDLWNDGKAYRIFCHRSDDASWILDSLGPGLH